MKNTKIEYLYRDASNFKIYCEEVMTGRIGDNERERFNQKHNERSFYPGKLGLPAPTFIDQGFKENEDDVDFHEFIKLAETDRPATVPLSVRDFVEGFKTVICEI